MRFEDLRLSEPILRAIAAEGYTTPTPIQVKAIPHVLEGSDLLGCAQTGTGKTAAFALPILQRLSEKKPHAPAHKPHGHAPHRRHTRTLILCPTRELASQIADSFRAYGRNLHLKHTVVFGGVSQHHQVVALKTGVDILIATPGRLLDLMNQGYVDLQHVEVFVLDEADRMLDMGFLPDIRKIVARIPQKRQTLLFSATMPSDIRRLAESILNKPVSVQVDPVASTVETVAQSVYFIERNRKAALLTYLLRKDGTSRTLVFTRTKHGADRVVKHLLRAGIKAEAIHGNKSQNNRTRALKSFKSDTPPVLVATDIASRGIDVDEISHVFNYDMPNVPETYVHRIGRTARAGASGIAVSFCDHEERADLRAIEKLIRIPIPVNRELPDLTKEMAQVHTHTTGRDHEQERPERRSHSHNGHGAKPSGGSHHSPRREQQHPKSSSKRSSTNQSRSTHPVHQPKRDGHAGGPAPTKHARGIQFRGRTTGRGRSR